MESFSIYVHLTVEVKTKKKLTSIGEKNKKYE